MRAVRIFILNGKGPSPVKLELRKDYAQGTGYSFSATISNNRPWDKGYPLHMLCSYPDGMVYADTLFREKVMDWLAARGYSRPNGLLNRTTLQPLRSR